MLEHNGHQVLLTATNITEALAAVEELAKFCLSVKNGC